MHLLMYIRWNLGVSFGYGVIKENGRGGLVKSHDFYFVYFLKKLTRYMLQTSYADENYHFLTYSAKNPAKIPCFYDFLAKSWFFTKFHASKFPRARWLYNVTATSYEFQWYSFWYQWLENVDTHELVANIGYQAFRIENPGRGLQQPPFGGRVTKIPQEDEG